MATKKTAKIGLTILGLIAAGIAAMWLYDKNLNNTATINQQNAAIQNT